MGSEGGENLGFGWVSARLKDVCIAECGIQTGPFGSQLHQSDYVPSGTPIITVEHLGDNRIVHEDLPLVSDHDRRRLERYSLRSGDIVFSRVGSVDRSALVRSAEDGWLFSGRCLRLRPDLNKIDPEFLSYYFSQTSFKAHIRAIAVGATMPSINTQILSNVQISYPVDIAEQKRIAHILGTLDDKIELNRQMNKTLEEMARALFKSWFVDFDPVRAKMCGRWTRTTPLPGLPSSLFDLFPDHLVDSELGEIPAGWEVRSVWDMAEFVNGAAYSAFEPNDERIGLPIVKIAELKAGITHQTKFSSVQMLDRYRIKDGDILFSWSGNPDTSIDTFVWSGGPAWLNQHIFKVIPNRPEERTFVLMLLLSLKPVFAEIARDKQTTGLGHVTAGDLRRLSIVVPCSIIMREWERMIGPVALALHQNTVVGRMLEELREVQLESLIPA